ncbi:GNAT family N-acetyltransferase [Psychrobium sp. 1_MG-2023]|uniref:GNAT family N-acetyltransferase n=1 Tax=Psychrobium sp. 1_MG-2023 TaxID=3062624 RepID=UPI002733EABD|nr:GNAT family N-acetyltransferase [Psychrobium sp. 1_MG-2023]MDP2560406.1 GNAT family N-acetyltransferase [Psychrobium sp. 1_MG-2023]
MLQPQSIELATDKVILKPLTQAHLDQFYRAGRCPSLWQWVKPNPCQSINDAAAWLDIALTKVASGEQVAFVIIDRFSGQLVGSTRLCSIDLENKGIEIGFTFIVPEFQRSHINTHAKYLLLNYAFETLGAIRVQFKTHQHNQKSRNAIRRLGAQFEGVLRQQRLFENGETRDTALYSIIDKEWAEVKKGLESCMLAKTTGQARSTKVGLELTPKQASLIENYPLAHLMVASSDNLLAQVIHIPLIYDRNSHRLIGHLARDNKLVWLLENCPTVTFIFHGADTYISPTKHPEQRVPTWDYRMLQGEGLFRFLSAGKESLQSLIQQVDFLEQQSWHIEQLPKQAIDQKLDFIRCFEISLAKVELVEKLSINTTLEHRHSIAKRLIAEGKKELASWYQT